jgi:predicted membrane protein
MCEPEFVAIVICALFIIPSILCYMIGEIVLDAQDLKNKDDLYEEITRTHFYTYCKVELALISTVLALIVFNAIFSNIDSDSRNLFIFVAFIVPFFLLGIAAAIFTLLIFVDMKDSSCQEKLQKVEEFVNNTEWDSEDGHILRTKFPNTTDMNEIYTEAQNWANEICGKGYNTRALIVGLGGIGFFLFITSPCGIAYYFIALLFIYPPPHGF